MTKDYENTTYKKFSIRLTDKEYEELLFIQDTLKSSGLTSSRNGAISVALHMLYERLQASESKS